MGAVCALPALGALCCSGRTLELSVLPVKPQHDEIPSAMLWAAAISETRADFGSIPCHFGTVYVELRVFLFPQEFWWFLEACRSPGQQFAGMARPH